MPKITDKQIIEKDPYRSILNVIRLCSHLDEQKKPVGATFGQIFEGLQGEEKKDDPIFYKIGLVERGCVKDKERLTEQLRLLVDRGFIKRDPKSKPRYYRYLPTAKHLHVCHLEDIYSRYLSYEPDTVLAIKTTKEDIDSDLYLFGFPPNSIDMSSREGHEIFEWLKVIDDTLRKFQKKKPGRSLDFHWHVY